MDASSPPALQSRFPWRPTPVPSPAVLDACREALSAVRQHLGTIQMQDSTGRTLWDQIELFQRFEIFWAALPHPPSQDTPAARMLRFKNLPSGTTTLDNTQSARSFRIAQFAQGATNALDSVPPLSSEIVAGLATVLGPVSRFQLTHLSRRECEELAGPLSRMLARYGGAEEWSVVHSLLEAHRFFFAHTPGQAALHSSTWDGHTQRWWQEVLAPRVAHGSGAGQDPDQAPDAARVEAALQTLTTLGRSVPDPLSTALIRTLPVAQLSGWMGHDLSRRSQLAAWLQTGVGESNRERAALARVLCEGLCPEDVLALAHTVVETVRTADPQTPDRMWQALGAQALVLHGLTQAVAPVLGSQPLAKGQRATPGSPAPMATAVSEDAEKTPSIVSSWIDLALDVLGLPSPQPTDPTQWVTSTDADWNWAGDYNGQQSMIWRQLLHPALPMTPAHWTAALQGTFSRGMKPESDGTLQMLLALQHIPPDVVAEFLATTLAVPLRNTVANNRTLMADARIRQILLTAGRSKPIWRLLFQATTDPAEAVTILEYLVQCGAQEEAARLLQRWPGPPLQLSTGLLKVFLASPERGTRVETVRTIGTTAPAVRPLADLPARAVRRTPKR